MRKWFAVLCLFSVGVMSMGATYAITEYTSIITDITDTIAAAIPVILAAVAVIFAGLLAVQIGTRLIRRFAK